MHTGASPQLDTFQSRPELAKIKGSAARYGIDEPDEMREMRKNLDPLIFADREFASELLEEQEMNTSK